jgi:outer membrane lipoprotein carrier protein
MRIDQGGAVLIIQRVLVTMLVVFAVGRAAQAQVEAFECSAGSELASVQGKGLLGHVQKQYASLEFMHGSFRQDSFVAALEQSESSAGEVWFGKPGKMRWVYTTPQAQTVIIRGKELWLYQPDKQQVLIDDIGQVLLSALPVSFMMGVGSLSKDFDYRGACRTREGTVLRLQPRDAQGKGGTSEGLEGFLLLVDERTNLPKGAKITSLGGNVTAIVFNNVSTQGDSFSANTFVLEYPKGVDVVDRRIQRQQ